MALLRPLLLDNVPSI